MQFFTKFSQRARVSVPCIALSFAVLTGCTPESDIVHSTNEELVVPGNKGYSSIASDDLYDNFAELVAAEPNAFQIDVRNVQFWNVIDSKTIVFTPHGGGIEPGTTEIADAIADAPAGANYDFYSFTGTKPSGNGTLHITSTHFDEPVCEQIVGVSTRTISIHGCQGNNAIVYASGRDNQLVAAVSSALSNAGFTVSNNPPAELSGTSPSNICNRNAIGKGVQLEISKGLRLQMMAMLNSATGRANSKTAAFYSFVGAVRSALRSSRGGLQARYTN